jgi:transposase
MFTSAQDPDDRRCPACVARDIISRGHAQRRFRSVPIGSRPSVVVLPVRRVEWRAGFALRQVEVPFADPRRCYTKSFERYALEPSRRYAKPNLKGLRCIVIDEIAVAKGHRYLAVVVGPDSGAVVLVGDGKGAEALHPSWKRLRPSGARIDAVAMDMSADRRAVSIHLPQAAILLDHFHVIKLFNDKLSDLQRAPYREATA